MAPVTSSMAMLRAADFNPGRMKSRPPQPQRHTSIQKLHTTPRPSIPQIPSSLRLSKDPTLVKAPQGHKVLLGVYKVCVTTVLVRTLKRPLSEARGHESSISANYLPSRLLGLEGRTFFGRDGVSNWSGFRA